MAKPVDISLSLCGVTLSNPLILSAGPYGRDSETLTRAAKAGFSALTTKTIRLTEAKNPFPNIAQIGKENLINAEKWSDLPLKTWIEHEIPKTKLSRVPLIASVGSTEKEVRKIAPLVEQAGADFIEIVSYDAHQVLPMLKAAKSTVHIPVIVKVSGNWHNAAKITMKAEHSGADAISAIDSIGPVLAIDVETGKPYLGSRKGEGWLSGEAIHSTAVKTIADIAQTVKIPVIGIGGVTKGRDAVEMMMAGAQCIGLCTAPIIHGLKVVQRIKQEMIEFMEHKKYTCLQEFCGIALRKIKDQTAEIKKKLKPDVDTEKCTLCGICVNLCPNQALTIKKNQTIVSENKCLSCGLCYSICPSHAIAIVRC